MKIGIGYDLHSLVKGRRMVIGGVNIPFSCGPLGHSDGDALLHAICDALLGASGFADIGCMFPDTDPKYKDVPSIRFLEEVYELVTHKGFKIINVDCVVIAEKPKISDYREKIIAVIGGVLNLPKESVNVKGKTSEGLDSCGRGEAIAAYAVALID